MKREEIADELAQKLLASLAETVRSKPCAFYHAPEDEPNAVEVGFQTDMGLVKMRFYPSKGFAEWAHWQGSNIANSILDGFIIKSQLGTTRLRDGEIGAGLEKDAPELMASLAMVSFFEALSINLSAALKTAAEDATAIALQKIRRGTVRAMIGLSDGLDSIKVGGVDEWWAATNERAARNREEAFAEVFKRLTHEPELERIAAYYAELHPIWLDASRIFKSNGGADWRGMVKVKYQDTKIAGHDLKFDVDLLARLASETATLPTGVQTRILTQGGDHTPGTIAIEHAARMCGASPYQFHVTKLLRERREQIGEGGE